MKIERFECFHYGCLMWIIASTHLLRFFKQWSLKEYDTELSELKFFKLITSMRQEMKDALKSTNQQLSGILDQLAPLIERTCVKEQKKNRLIPLKIITNLA